MAVFIALPPGSPTGTETITVDNTVGGKALTTAKIDTVAGGADAALITVEAQSLRFTVDGTTPVATTTGHLLAAGDMVVVRGMEALRKFRAIREGGSSSTIQVSYFRAGLGV